MPTWLFPHFIISTIFSVLSSIEYTQSANYCCCSVSKSCSTLCDIMNYSMLGFPALTIFQCAQTYVHWVSDADPPLPTSPVFNPSQHQGLFQWPGSSHQVTKLGLSFRFSMFRLNFLRIGYFDLLALQGSPPIASEASVLWHSTWFSFHVHTWLL